MGTFSNFDSKTIKPNCQSITELKFMRSIYAKTELFQIGKEFSLSNYQYNPNNFLLSWTFTKAGFSNSFRLPKFDSRLSMSFKYQNSQLCKTMNLCALKLISNGKKFLCLF